MALYEREHIAESNVLRVAGSALAPASCHCFTASLRYAVTAGRYRGRELSACEQATGR